MIIETIVTSAFQQNTRVVGCPETKQAIVIDPGDDNPQIAAAIARHGLNLQAIALTHAHLDHIGGVSALKETYPDAEIILHADDLELYNALPEQPAALGIPRAGWAQLGFLYPAPPPVDKFWTDGETYVLGKLAFKILHCPGHAPGHVVFYEKQARKLFGGDCLFAGSIGRTDLPGGSSEQLMDSLINKIVPLGDDVEVYTGHGADTTIGYERRTNPFLTGVYALGGR